MMLSTCGEFNRMWRILADRGALRVYAHVYYTPCNYAVVHISGQDVQTIEYAGKTINLLGSSNITKITYRVKHLLPTVVGITMFIEFPDKTYSEHRNGPVDSPEVVTLLFKRVVVKIGGEK